MGMADISLDKLAALTTRLELDVPSIKGSFPDFGQVEQQLHGNRGRGATYVLGTIKSGKSTMLSALIAADILPRGSGVKTFNLSRVVAAAERWARVNFKSSSQLAGMIRFDFRILGCDFEVPPDLYAPEAGQKLRELLTQFEALARDDGRLERLRNSEDSQGFLSLSLARVRQLILCLERLHRDVTADLVTQVRLHHELVFRDDRFTEYLAWANSLEYSVIIQEIEIGLPFPEDLSATHQLVDCQGSDSLNPLDFAAVDAALHRAEHIFYVANSRLGLRAADKNLLAHVNAAGLSKKTVFIFNVEAFEPLSAIELEQLITKFKGDLASLNLQDAAVCSVNALYELRKRTNHADHCLIRSVWRDRGCEEVLTGLERDFTSLLSLSDSLQAERGEVAAQRVTSVLRWRAQTTARALLTRDKSVLGVERTELRQNEVHEAVRRVLGGERLELQQRLNQLAHEAFDKHGGLQKAVDLWIKSGPREALKAHPLPEYLKGVTKHGPVMVAALEAFNTDWMLCDQRLLVAYVRPFIDDCLAAIEQSISRAYKVIFGTIVPHFSDVSEYALPHREQVISAIKNDLERYQSAATMHEVLRPVIFAPLVASRLAAEFYARKLLHIVKARVRKGSSEPAIDQKKIEALWRKSLVQAHKAAVQDQEFSVSSARENYKFQFLVKAVNTAFERCEQMIMASISSYYAHLEQLEKHSQLLLTGEDRRKIEEYLAIL